MGSSFNVTAENAHKVATSSTSPEIADVDLGDVMNSAGGQYSSLRDFESILKGFLNPSGKDSLLSPYTMREWVRSLHALPDGISEVGAPWEITKISDMWRTTRRWYGKGGNLGVYHSEVTFNPDASFGVVVLMTGRYPDSPAIAAKAVQIYQEAFDRHRSHTAADLFAGHWWSQDNAIEAITAVYDGGLWLVKLVLNGTDVFQSLEGPHPVSKSFGMWATGRQDEFRIAFGRATTTGLCFPTWATFDPVYAKGAPIDLVLFEGAGTERVMKVPSVGGTLERRGWFKKPWEGS